ARRGAAARRSAGGGAGRLQQGALDRLGQHQSAHEPGRALRLLRLQRQGQGRAQESRRDAQPYGRHHRASRPERAPPAGARGQMRRLAVVLALFAGACATEGEVSRTLYKRLPRDARMAIYDRENDLTIARSRRDEALAQLAEIGRRKDELSQALKAGET